MERSGNLDRAALKKAKVFAEKLAVVVGESLLNRQEKVQILKYKDRQDILTDADLESEKIIIQAVKKNYPDHDIFSEEQGTINKGSPYIWIIDPLDGTKEYLRGLPLYNVSLCLKERDNVVLATVYRPTDRQLFSAVKDGDVVLNKKPIAVSHQKILRNSFLYCFLPRYLKIKKGFNFTWGKLGKLAKRVYRLRALSDENTMLCWLAMGGCEGFVNIGDPPERWDILPGLFIARQAGAKVTDIKGNDLGENFEKGIVVTNGKIHEQILRVLNA